MWNSQPNKCYGTSKSCSCSSAQQISYPGAAKGKVNITMVARFSSQKKQVQLIHAIGQLKGDFVVRFVVEGSQLEDSIELANKLGVSDRAEFLGNRNDVADILADSNIGILTTHYEGLPISLIEKLRAGLPIIATDVGGIGELVKDSSNGYLIARDDTVSLVKHIQSLIDNPAMRESMGRESRRIFLADYLVDRFLDRTENIYTKVVYRRKTSNQSVMEKLG